MNSNKNTTGPTPMEPPKVCAMCGTPLATAAALRDARQTVNSTLSPSDTPETDKEDMIVTHEAAYLLTIEDGAWNGAVSSNFARKLERERDEARAAITELRATLNIYLTHPVNSLIEQLSVVLEYCQGRIDEDLCEHSISKALTAAAPYRKAKS